MSARKDMYLYVYIYVERELFSFLLSREGGMWGEGRAVWRGGLSLSSESR